MGTSIPLTRSSWVDTTGHSEQNVTGMDICLWSTELLPLVKTTIWAPLHELTVDGDFVNNIYYHNNITQFNSQLNQGFHESNH